MSKEEKKTETASKIALIATKGIGIILVVGATLLGLERKSKKL